MHRKTILVTLIALFSLATVSAFGQEVKGMIKKRSGDKLIVATTQGDVTVVLADDTVTKDNTGLFGLRKDKMADVVLIPGLKVDVDGTPGENGQVVAKTITVDGDDLETSEMIEAGVHPTAEQVAANVQKLAEHEAEIEGLKAQLAALQQNRPAREKEITVDAKDSEPYTEHFMALTDYDVKGQAIVHFSTGSSTISAADQEELQKLAQTATGLNGYLVEVAGFADSTGSAAMNTKLSEDRAKAVVTFLMQQGGVPVRRIVAPGALGEYGPAASNETKAGRAENRRVEVKLLVNKETAGG
jgi:outer membrane protein OmpA-like peptidoglycan-associated protein